MSHNETNRTMQQTCTNRGCFGCNLFVFNSRALVLLTNNRAFWRLGEVAELPGRNAWGLGGAPRITLFPHSSLEVQGSKPPGYPFNLFVFNIVESWRGKERLIFWAKGPY